MALLNCRLGAVEAELASTQTELGECRGSLEQMRAELWKETQQVGSVGCRH